MRRDVILADQVGVAQHTDELDGLPVFWREREEPDDAAAARSGEPGRRAGGNAAGTVALYLHDAPLSADEWAPFLAAETGPAVAVDLPGFGRSGKPGSLPYDLPFYDAWLERFLDWRGLDRVHLVMHGWGALGLLLAQRAPERIDRLVLIAPVPFLPGFRWHRAARLWRTPIVGELVVGATTRRRFRRALPPELAEDAWRQFDPGTQRALLRLHRNAPEHVLALAGEHLGDISPPALIACGESDPYIDADFADAYGARMPGATVVRIAAAGHWPWLDDHELAGRVVAFLRG
jgi:pimeloyl-ACP methyl ester carboxylesterase